MYLVAGPIPGSEALQEAVRILARVAAEIEADNNDCSRYAVCFDIDDTMLLWEGEDAVVNAPALELYNLARRLGMRVFVVTARPKTLGNIRNSVEQLRELGYDLSAVPRGGLYLMPKKYMESGEIGEFKDDARKHIQKRFGVEIVAMVGDQWTDVFPQGDEDGFARQARADAGYVLVDAGETVPLGVKLEDRL